MVTYIAGGLLGDFIHSLSVCKSIFDATGQKAIVLISDHVGDRFKFGAQKAYEDLRTLLTAQEYIAEFRVYANEPYDINLTQWRQSPLLYRATWDIIYNTCYQLSDWGQRAWIIPTQPTQQLTEYKDTIFFNSSMLRFVASFPYQHMMQLITSKQRKCMFLCFHPNDAFAFFERAGIKMDICVVKDINDMANHIMACHAFIGNLSSPLAICIACNKYCMGILGEHTGDGIHMKNVPIPNYNYWCDAQSYSKSLEEFLI